MHCNILQQCLHTFAPQCSGAARACCSAMPGQTQNPKQIRSLMLQKQELLHFSTQSVDDDVAHMQQELCLGDVRASLSRPISPNLEVS